MVDLEYSPVPTASNSPTILPASVCQKYLDMLLHCWQLSTQLRLRETMQLVAAACKYHDVAGIKFIHFYQ